MMRYPLLTLLTAGSIAAGMAHAQQQPPAASTTITFTGVVTDQTCQVGVNGGASGQVTVEMLPVHADDFKEIGTVAGKTPFTLFITGCQSQGQLNGVAIDFKRTQVDGSSYLFNTAANGANGVALRLLDEWSKEVIEPGKWSAKLELPKSASSPSKHDFSVEYVKTGDTIKPGKVEAVAIVDMYYR